MLRLITLQIGFVPISVVLITLWLNRLISQRENRQRVQKRNIATSNFFMEIGTPLLEYLISFDSNSHELGAVLLIKTEWSERDFAVAKDTLRDQRYSMKTEPSDLEALCTFLNSKRSFLTLVLENPSLLEQEDFTNLLSAIAHLTEELVRRIDLTKLGKADYDHITNDIIRVYALLLPVWLDYMKHIKENYPYLYSLSVRTNPFDPLSSPEIKEG